jgi:hypothetical protein
MLPPHGETLPQLLLVEVEPLQATNNTTTADTSEGTPNG